MGQLAEKLTKLVPLKGDSKSDVARKLGISSQLLGQYMSGRQEPKGMGFYNKWKETFGEDLFETIVSHGTGSAAGLPQLATLLTQLMEKQNQLMAMQNKILEETKEEIKDKVKEIHANSNSTLTHLDTITRVMRAENAVIMSSLDRLEKQPQGTHQKQRGKLEVKIAGEQKKRGK